MKNKRWDEPNLTRSRAIKLIQEFPDIVYKNQVQEKLVECVEDPFAVANLLGNCFRPMLKKAVEDRDRKTTCFICEMFRKIKVSIFPLEPEPQCAGDRCEILKEEKKCGIRKGEGNRVSKGVQTKRRGRRSKNERSVSRSLSSVEKQTEECSE